jgi:hypothetical protein
MGGGMETAPTVYKLDGKQYLLTPIGNLLVAWTLAE